MKTKIFAFSKVHTIGKRELAGMNSSHMVWLNGTLFTFTLEEIHILIYLPG